MPKHSGASAFFFCRKLLKQNAHALVVLISYYRTLIAEAFAH